MAAIVAGHGLLDEADAALVAEVTVLVLGVDDDEPALVVFEVPLDQRQRAFADRPKSDHHDRSGDFTVNRPIRHSLLQTQSV